MGILTYIFYDNLDKSIPIHVNPFSIPLLCGVIPLGIFVGLFFVKQTKLVSRGLTTKQQVSIDRNGNNYNTNLTKGEGLENIIKFLLKPIPDSLIN